MDSSGIAILLLLLFGGMAGAVGGSDSDDEGETNDTDDTIYDDTNDPDNGLVEGTERDDLLIGSIEAGGPDGAENDMTFPNDTIRGFGGDDTLLGGNGADTLFGGADADTLFGGTDADILEGEDGDDTLDGGDGDDTLRGGAGLNTMTGGVGDDTFEVVLDDTPDVITDFSNEEGNRDFIDLTSHFANLEEARAAFDGTNLAIGDAEIVFSNNPDADVFTTETTGLDPNVAPEANDDTVDVLLGANSVGGVAMTLVSGTQVGAEADTDADGETANLQIASINGVDVAPSDTVSVMGAQSLFVQPNGQTVVVNVDTAADFMNEGGSVSFTYTVVDAFGAESDPATARLNVTVVGEPV